MHVLLAGPHHDYKREKAEYLGCIDYQEIAFASARVDEEENTYSCALIGESMYILSYIMRFFRIAYSEGLHAYSYEDK
ncbi:hypothetical protein Tco_0885593 [Tanacetum coccineum]